MTRGDVDALVRSVDDHEAFCRHSLRIRDEAGSLLPMILRPGQIRLHEAIEKQRRAKKPVRIVVVKTRRSNFTAGACAEIFKHIAVQWPGRKATIVADTYRPAGVEAFGYLKDFHHHYVPFESQGVRMCLPLLKKDTDEQLKYSNDSMIEVLSAERGEIRGGGRHVVLCDELAFWRDAKTTLAGVLNMVPRLPTTMIIAQSTANGRGNAFYELVQQAMDPLNDSGWEFVFFGWLDHPLNRIALTGDEHARLTGTLDKDEKTLVAMHQATPEQLAWRRWKIKTDLVGDVQMFNQEYPTTVEEAFISSGRPGLDHKALARMPITTPRVGEIEMVQEFPTKRYAFTEKEFGRLSIWKLPERGRRYGCGADPSHGKDVSREKSGKNPDYSVGFIGDIDTGEQVAMLRDRLRPGPFAEYLALVCKYYNFAYMCPEANDPGFIDALVREYPAELIYARRRDPTDKRPETTQDLGFETNEQTRHWLVQAIDEAIRGGGITIHSSVMLQECYTFIYKPNGKIEHADDCHDDTVLAGSLFCMARRFAPRVFRQYEEKSELARRGSPMRSYGQRRRNDDD